MRTENNVKNEETGNSFVSTVVSPTAEVNDNPLQALKDEVKREKDESVFKTKSTLFDAQVPEDDDSFSYITQAFCSYFKLGPVGFKSGVTGWNFPKSIKDKTKRHSVKRQYFHQGIMVDVFNKGTKVEEINKIKAHLEAIGFKYTYILGGETLDPEKIFGKRLAKFDPKSPNYPKIKVPMSLEEAGFVGYGAVLA
jgi:hypothetical protein